MQCSIKFSAKIMLKRKTISVSIILKTKWTDKHAKLLLLSVHFLYKHSMSATCNVQCDRQTDRQTDTKWQRIWHVLSASLDYSKQKLAWQWANEMHESYCCTENCLWERRKGCSREGDGVILNDVFASLKWFVGGQDESQTDTAWQFVYVDCVKQTQMAT